MQAIALCPGLVHTEFHERGNVDVSNAPDWMWLDVGEVVDAACATCGAARSISIPSLRYKALTGAGRLVPATAGRTCPELARTASG